MAGNIFCPELVDNIFSFLETKDLLTASHVCPFWNAITQLSLKRRLLLQVDNKSPANERYSLDFQNREFRNPKKFQTVREEECDHQLAIQIEKSDLRKLKFDGRVVIYSPCEKYPILPILAITFLPAYWCLKITELEIYNSLALQDWEVVGTFVLSKFPSLIKLELILKWIPEYVSALETQSEVLETNFETIRKISMDFFDLHLCILSEKLNLQFVTRCPNLQKFKLREVSTDYSVRPIPFVCYGNSHGIKTLRLDFLRLKDICISPLAWYEILRDVHKLQFTVLNVENSICGVWLLKARVSENLKSIRVEIGPSADLVEFVLLVLQDKKDSWELEDLRVYWNPTFGLQPMAFDKSIRSTDFTLPSIKRFELIGISAESESEDAKACPTYKRFLTALPNLELFLVHCDFLMYSLITTTQKRCFERLVYPSSFLKYSMELQNLRHLVWGMWNFCSEDSVHRKSLEEIKAFLAQHQALESLTIVLEGKDDKIFSALEAVVNGCKGLPRMRFIMVHLSLTSKLKKSQKWKNLESNATSLIIRFEHFLESSYWRIEDYQIHALDQILKEEKLKPTSFDQVSTVSTDISSSGSSQELHMSSCKPCRIQ